MPDNNTSVVTRRKWIQLLGVSSFGLASMSAEASNHSPGIEITDQTTDPDRIDSDDFPVPDAYQITVDSVVFQEDTGTIAIPVENSDGEQGVSEDDTFWYEAQTDDDGSPLPAFVVGLHSPNVGSGRPDQLDSLIGVRPLRPGEYTDVVVPIWQGPPPWQRSLGASREEYPTDGETLEVTATIWYGPDVFPPTADRDSDAAVAQTPTDEQNGPVSVNGSLVSDSAQMMFPSQTDEGPPTLPGQENPPQDLDGDGLYEDIDGDGELSIGDVQVFFQNRGSDAVQNNADFFNFADNDPPDVTVGDVQALFELFQEQG